MGQSLHLSPVSAVLGPLEVCELRAEGAAGCGGKLVLCVRRPVVETWRRLSTLERCQDHLS